MRLLADLIRGLKGGKSLAILDRNLKASGSSLRKLVVSLSATGNRKTKALMKSALVVKTSLWMVPV